MKSFSAMNTVDKAKAFFDLFPQYIPPFITYMHDLQRDMNMNAASYEKEWKNTDLEFSAWLNLAKVTRDTINEFADTIGTKRDVFARQLFKGYTRVWTEHCLLQYANTANCPEILRKAIDFFFGYSFLQMDVLVERKQQVENASRRFIYDLVNRVEQQKGPAPVEIMTANQGLRIGVPDGVLDGNFEVTHIRVANHALLLQLDGITHYYTIEELLNDNLSLTDQLAIANTLHEFLYAKDTP